MDRRALVRVGVILAHVSAALAHVAEDKVFTAEELKQYDGSDETKPIYVSILGQVYDVSESKKMYGKGEGYNVFAGRDASRAFAKSCFKEDCLSDSLEGLTADELKSANQWLEFFQKKYKLVGKFVRSDEQNAKVEM